jgi:Uncharacterized protein conserved in bacteria (DUF2313).
MIIDKLPQYYRKSEFIKCLSNALENEKTIFLNYVEATKKEYYIKTTSENIYDWEREFKVPSYLNQDIQTRRGNVLGRFRGFGTSNKNFIRSVVEGFYEGEVVDIVEGNDGIITLYFKTKKGLPENHLELQRTVEELLPAHLEYAYKFIFALDNYEHEELEPYEHKVLEGAIHSGV